MDLTKKINDLIKAKDEHGLDALINKHGGHIFKAECLTAVDLVGIKGECFYSDSFEEALKKTKDYLRPLQQKEASLLISLELITKIFGGGLEYCCYLHFIRLQLFLICLYYKKYYLNS